MKPSKPDAGSGRLMSSREIKALLEAHKETLEEFTVKRIRLFGSYATGTQSAASDIDFVVDFDKPTFDNYMGLVNYLEKILGKKVNVLTPDGVESIRVPKVAQSIKRSLVDV